MVREKVCVERSSASRESEGHINEIERRGEEGGAGLFQAIGAPPDI
jgi:hypothetical protein